MRSRRLCSRSLALGPAMVVFLLAGLAGESPAGASTSGAPEHGPVEGPALWVAIAAIAVLATLFVARGLAWLGGRRATGLDRERRHCRARLGGRALIAAATAAAGTQLYRVAGSASSSGVRGGMLGISIAALVFQLLGEVRQHRFLSVVKRDTARRLTAGPGAGLPNWAPQESTVVQHIIPVGDIVPISTPHDGVLLLGDFLRTGDEEAPAWSSEAGQSGTHDRAGPVPLAAAAPVPERPRVPLAVPDPHIAAAPAPPPPPPPMAPPRGFGAPPTHRAPSASSALPPPVPSLAGERRPA